ncbi:MAG: Verru_Chthon cassette protein C [Verrucomicrobiaceae bacterium]
MKSSAQKPSSLFITSRGFTLVEVMVSVTILVVLMMIVANFVSLVQRTWVRSNSQVSQFREARLAFDLLTRNLSQATLNTYWENEFENLGNDSAGQVITKAKNYIRQSELQFVCGPTVGANGLFATGDAQSYPGHGVFFQAPLGVTGLVPTTTNGSADTQNLVNLMCGRGYFVEWGSDESFRPAFLSTLTSVPPRFRLRLMEFSPTAEQNMIYNPSFRPIISNSKKWFQGALNSEVQSGAETAANRAVTRPVAENILCLVIAPQNSVAATSLGGSGGGSNTQYSIAPQYAYDSTLITNPGATAGTGGTQGTRHLLPPILKVSMVALDHLAGEQLSSNQALRQSVISTVGGLFKSASQLQSDLDGTSNEPGTLEKLLISKRLNFRIFTTSISLKQSRWSL